MTVKEALIKSRWAQFCISGDNKYSVDWSFDTSDLIIDDSITGYSEQAIRITNNVIEDENGKKYYNYAYWLKHCYVDWAKEEYGESFDEEEETEYMNEIAKQAEEKEANFNVRREMSERNASKIRIINLFWICLIAVVLLWMCNI